MRILVAVIAYNEERSIRDTIKDLIENNFGYDIILIDNGSYDDTVKISKELGINVISHCINSGSSSGTLMSYFLYAYRNNYDILCQFDGDGQHIASELPKIIEPIKNEEADYVIGSRFLQKNGFRSYFFRRIGIKLFSYLDSKLIGQKITDVTSGFRAYNRKIIEFFAKFYKHEVYDTSQLLLISGFSGAKIKEVPIIMKERNCGKSEFNLLNSISFPIEALINIIGCLLQKNQIYQIMEDNYGN